MGGLGNIFDEHDDATGPGSGSHSGLDADDASRGPDLRVSAEVPRAALGCGVRVEVPQRLAAEGDLVERVTSGEDPDRVTLHLPEELPPGAVLRLRGQGGLSAEGGRAGDLFVVVELVERAAKPGEIIPGGSTPPEFDGQGGAGVGEGQDRTWLILGALALVAGGAVAASALLF